jgi:hypothetical protein
MAAFSRHSSNGTKMTAETGTSKKGQLTRLENIDLPIHRPRRDSGWRLKILHAGSIFQERLTRALGPRNTLGERINLV